MRRILKWVGIVLLGLVVLLVLIGGVMYYIGSSRIEAEHEVATAHLELPTDSAALAYGRHLSLIHGCRECHGSDLSGQIFIDAPPFRVTASNLTPGRGGVGAAYSAVDFDRAIRHGLRPDGRAVQVMPSAAFHNMSDADAAALIAHLQTVPAVDNELPPTEIKVIGRIMSAAAMDPAYEVRTDPARSVAPTPGPTAEYGKYLSSITCQYCHGADLRGAQPPNPSSPPAPDLAAAGSWTLEQFKHALRTGERPAGPPLQAEYMPYMVTNHMKDLELEALHLYLSTLGNQAGM